METRLTAPAFHGTGASSGSHARARKRPMRRRLFALLVVGVACVAGSRSLEASWYGESVENGADIMLMDVCWPFWPESTYSAIWNFGTNPSGLGGYGGFSNGIPSVPPDHRPNLDPAVQAAFHPGSVWSFWGSNKDGEPVRVVASSEYTFPRQYVNEGASGSLGSPGWPFMRNGEWYSMLMRVWGPAGVDDAQYSYVGRWIKDIKTGTWHLYGIMRLPVPAASFTGNNGFLEDVANSGRSVRSLYRRLGYYRKDGRWGSSNTVTFNVDPKKGRFDNYWVVEVRPEGDHEVLCMELSWNPKLLPQKLVGAPLEFGKQHKFTVRQPDQPTLDRPAVSSVTAQSNGRQVLVQWELAATSSPQFLYRVEVFDNAACHGKPVAVCEQRMPTERAVLLDAAVADPTVRFSMTDIFDQAAQPIVRRAQATAEPLPATAVRTANGLTYQLLDLGTERQPAVGLLEAGTLVQQGISRGFDISLANDRTSRYGFRFKGFLRVPAQGLYVLRMQGSDGYRITIDGQEVLLWDGPHGPAERSGVVNLCSGDHALLVDYFVGGSASPFFKLDWEGPGMSREAIPTSALLHEDSGHMPAATLTATQAGDGTARVVVAVDAKGRAIQRTQLFSGAMRLADSETPSLTYEGPLLEGTNSLWSRVVYDTRNTVDSEPLVVVVDAIPVRDGWTQSVVGESKVARGLWQTAADAFSFVGEGEYVVTRQVEGDCTLTCRMDSSIGTKGEPVNGWSWAGLTAREHGTQRSWGKEFGVFQTARFGVRTTPNFSDQGASRLNDYELPKEHPWLRVARRGNVWTAWTSADGKRWECGAIHLKPTAARMDAGLVFRALPQDARAYFQARVSNVTLEQGFSRDLVMPAPTAATHTEGARLSGVVLARSDAAVVVVRSTDGGLLRSVDGGTTWSPANGELTGAANAVRSVAIHPQDPRIMLRAAGRVAGAGDWDGGLWKTTDGGATWKKLEFAGDFDGNGPSALCGEVIAFDPAKPDRVYVGTETKGLFRTEDGGLTWTKLGIDGERITAVALNGWSRGQNDMPILHAVTCPDALMPLLGRGTPGLSATVKTSHDYVTRDGGAALHPTCEWADLGYLNIGIDKGSTDEPSYATTHGHCSSLGDCQMFLSPEVKNVEWLRPVTAIGCSGHGDTRCGRALLQSLDPIRRGRVSRSEHYGLRWDWIEHSGDVPAGGLIAACGEFINGDVWWLLATDGLYRSDDGGKHLKKVLDEKGTR